MPYSAVVETLPTLSYDNLLDLLSLVAKAIKERSGEAAAKDETEYLLSTPANREHLMRSIRQAERGELVAIPEAQL